MKFAPHLRKCIFLKYGTNGNFGYKLWELENYKMIRNSDVVFNEDSISTYLINLSSCKAIKLQVPQALCVKKPIVDRRTR